MLILSHEAAAALFIILLPLLQAFILESHKAKVFQIGAAFYFPIFFSIFYADITMSSGSSIKKNKLADQVRAEGFKLCFSYECCICLHKPYFKLSSSGCCNKCVQVRGSHYVMLELSFSDAE